MRQKARALTRGFPFESRMQTGFSQKNNDYQLTSRSGVALIL